MKTKAELIEMLGRELNDHENIAFILCGNNPAYYAYVDSKGRLTYGTK